MRIAIVAGLLLVAGCINGALVRAASADEAARPTTQPASTDWPFWRGPACNGVVQDCPKLLDSWPQEGPDLLWRSTGKIPHCISSPVVADGKVFVTGVVNHPAEETKDYLPIAEEALHAWGYVPDMPADLAKKIEEARLAPKRPNVRGVNWWDHAAEQDEQAAACLKKNPQMDAYVKEFIATLSPQEAEKYGAYIKRRFCAATRLEARDGNGVSIGWAGLAEMNAIVHDKKCRNRDEFWRAIDGTLKKDGAGAYSGAAEARGEIISTWAMEKSDLVVCLDAASGTELWRKEFAATDAAWKKSPGTGPYRYVSCSPAAWGGKCYAAGLNGLYCLSAKDGEVLWQTKGGMSHASVLAADGVVIYPAGGAAYDAETGKLLWKGCGSGTTSPVLWTCDGTKCVICAGTCFDLHSGKVRWRISGRSEDLISYGITPAIIGDLMIACNGVYKLTAEKAELLCKFPAGVADPAASPVVYQDHVYWMRNFYDYPVWHCVDIKTGQVSWTQKSPIPADTQCASAVLADGKLIHPIGMAHAGTPYLIEMLKATPEKFTQVSVFDPKVSAMSSPAVAGGKLYLRLIDGVACYDLAHCQPQVYKCAGNTLTLRLESPIDRDVWKEPASYAVSGAKITGIEVDATDSHLVRLVTDKTWKTGDKVTIKCPAMSVDKPEATTEREFTLCPGRPVNAGLMREFLFGEVRPNVDAPEKYGKDDVDMNAKPAAGDKWKVGVNESGIFNPAQELKAKSDRGLFHACVYVYSDAARKVQLWGGCQEAMEIFVNGKSVYGPSARHTTGFEADGAQIKDVSLAKGWNAVLLRVSNAYTGLTLALRIRDEQGHEPPAGLWYSAELPAGE